MCWCPSHFDKSPIKIYNFRLYYSNTANIIKYIILHITELIGITYYNTIVECNPAIDEITCTNKHRTALYVVFIITIISNIRFF